MSDTQLAQIAAALEALVQMIRAEIDRLDDSDIIYINCEGCGKQTDAADLITEGWRGDEDGYICAECASVEDVIERQVDEMIEERVLGVER
ncbi:hypothetical protein [Propionimicrobium sp. PCR01-08-3]|uniref:hypothetical protein n=1 Tax=Propionimicrobium sp. PCR01-08-3 TaxID=3052086 RepID=UPI00255C85EC|nr:hypothetical protein [Propionimicrobium sp. PCR01-08-3]WIY84304.1 hypothetical protein QQ658_15195 [Propionimicrobium sp. PCR01-08-3]